MKTTKETIKDSCRICGGAIEDAPHQKALDGMCGYCVVVPVSSKKAEVIDRLCRS
jgi:hypothetical protein